MWPLDEVYTISRYNNSVAKNDAIPLLLNLFALPRVSAVSTQVFNLLLVHVGLEVVECLEHAGHPCDVTGLPALWGH